MSHSENGIHFLLKWTYRNADITKWFHDWKKNFINHSKGSLFRGKCDGCKLLFLLILLRVLPTEQVMGQSLSWEQTSLGNNAHSQASIIPMSEIILKWLQKLNHA